ncbi:unnamed protein product [Trifolium pratense]|uniref:Uncharacterized protein n=1 Tax=Trifolium pratense TaxID=57577 RepID=A0ACB0KCN1_TRIPR|nr:unnamed protein product [Trifolium pratense]
MDFVKIQFLLFHDVFFFFVTLLVRGNVLKTTRIDLICGGEFITTAYMGKPGIFHFHFFFSSFCDFVNI